MDTTQNVLLTAEEADALRSRMRDLQAAVSRYYAATSKQGNFESELRAFITHTQAINDLLTEAIANRTSFKIALESQGEDAKKLLDAIKYIRNIDQHLLYSVTPDSENVRIVGGSFGFRFFPVWKSIPLTVHDRLRSSTRKLQPAFNDRLVGREISGSMMEVLRLLGALIPEAVHRDGNNEWSGFPLMSQPGMGYPLHPNEPLDHSQVMDWLSKRIPNGDLRVAMGLRIHQGVKYLYGNTWVKNYSFTPFMETIEQVQADISAGFTYLVCEDMHTLKSVSDEFADALQGGVLRSIVDVAEQGPPVTELHLTEEWITPGSEVFWDDVNIEVHKNLPESWLFEVRRARRLNALVPPSFISA